jgi:hypothetical protein
MSQRKSDFADLVFAQDLPADGARNRRHGACEMPADALTSPSARPSAAS